MPLFTTDQIMRRIILFCVFIVHSACKYKTYLLHFDLDFCLHFMVDLLDIIIYFQMPAPHHLKVSGTNAIFTVVVFLLLLTKMLITFVKELAGIWL